MADKPPFILHKPSLKILAAEAPATVPTADIELQCLSHGLTAEPEQDENDVKTFCGTYTTYGAEKWTITIAAYTSYGLDGLWNQLRPCVGELVKFELLPNGEVAVSEDNPMMTGVAMVKAFSFIDGEVDESSEIDVELAVQGEPEFLTTPPIVTAAATTSYSPPPAEEEAA